MIINSLYLWFQTYVFVVVIAPFVQWWYPVMVKVIPGRSALAVLGRVVMDQISGRISALCVCFFIVYFLPHTFLANLHYLIIFIIS